MSLRTILLFSYGTLQQPEVQRANFGRLLEGEPDALPGYRLGSVRIDDPEVVGESGSAVHPIVIRTGDAADLVAGIVFSITADELAAADEYETSAYLRVEAKLRSGTRAWVYAAPGALCHRPCPNRPGRRAEDHVTPLEKGQLWVMLVRSSIVSLILLGALALLASVLQERRGVPPALILLPALVVLGYVAFLAPRRRYRAWGYRIDAEELRLGHGVWTAVETLVPLKRVQHLDIAQGPLERVFGVCRLLLHTAGTANSLVVLPGLSRATAEAMRADIRARIRQEPE
jgi:uncharacterized protein